MIHTGNINMYHGKLLKLQQSFLALQFALMMKTQDIQNPNISVEFIS